MSCRSITFTVLFLCSQLFYSNSYASDESYWLWSGKTAVGLPENSTLYIHQGTLERGKDGKPPTLRKQGLGSINLSSHPIYIVYRIENLLYPNEIANLFKDDCHRWEKKGNKIIGLQIDFDSPSKKLDSYIDFLSNLKKMIPDTYLLAVTGLADWASSSPQAALRRLSHEVNEITFQLYEGSNEIPYIDSYVNSITRLEIPFKIGIMENQRYILEKYHFDAKFYRGSIIFK